MNGFLENWLSSEVGLCLLFFFVVAVLGFWSRARARACVRAFVRACVHSCLIDLGVYRIDSSLPMSDLGFVMVVCLCMLSIVGHLLSMLAYYDKFVLTDSPFLPFPGAGN